MREVHGQSGRFCVSICLLQAARAPHKLCHTLATDMAATELPCRKFKGTLAGPGAQLIAEIATCPGTVAEHISMKLTSPGFQWCDNGRYLAAKTTLPQHASQDFGGQTRSPLEKMPIQPRSMVQHPAYMTPVGRRSLALAGRGRRAAEDGGPIWQPKVIALASKGPSEYAACKSLTPLWMRLWGKERGGRGGSTFLGLRMQNPQRTVRQAILLLRRSV